MLFSVHDTDIGCFRHQSSLNKWQYCDEYIIVLWYCGKKIAKNRIKKLQKSGMSGIRTCNRQLQCQARSPLNHWDTWSLLLTRLT